MGTFLVLAGLIGICWGLVGLIRSFFKKGNKKRNFIIIGTAFILMIFGASISPTSHSDSSKASTQSEKKIETKRTSSTSSEEQLKQKAEHKEKEKQKLEAERKKQEEEKQKLEAERKKQEERQKLEAEREKQEEEKQKIEAERKAQEERQKQAENEATTALSQAEAHPTRENYNSAATLIQAIPNGNQHLSSARLATVDATIKANEAAEAERQRQAAAAQEQANQVAAAQTPQQNNEQTVYIAPDHGTKYHLNPNCSGLNNANSVVAISLQEAQARGYTLCKRG